jgi:hypothetical protein
MEDAMLVCVPLRDAVIARKETLLVFHIDAVTAENVSGRR